ncbi:MAG: hypothetical protein KDK39_16330, partial [Leptospiraceae bacterium]|nr:hypothetical protein [Leptospiraceae bacterium]
MRAKSSALSRSPIKVIADEPGFVAIHKAPGIPFQRTGQQAGALELLREIESTAALAWPGRLFPVHRLDKVTSGILLFARGR